MSLSIRFNIFYYICRTYSSYYSPIYLNYIFKSQRKETEVSFLFVFLHPVGHSDSQHSHPAFHNLDHAFRKD